MLSLKNYIKNACNNYLSFMSKEHKDYLFLLKQEGFEPDVIYDIGAGSLGWTRNAEIVWPHAKYIVFDAYQALQELYQEMNYDFHIGVLSDEDDKMIEYYQNNLYFLENSCCPVSLFSGYKREKTECLLRPSLTLKTVIERRDFPLPDFIYIHVNGMEMVILRDFLSSSIQKPKRIILAIYHNQVYIGASRWNEIVSYMKNIGYYCDGPLIGENNDFAEYGFYLSMG